MKIEVKRITEENSSALKLKNDPFLNEGRLIPKFDGENFTYDISLFKEATIDCFPDENYELSKMGDNFYGLAIYVDDICAGFILLYIEWNKWLYVDNLLISEKFRRLGLGSILIDEALKIAKELGEVGLYLVCQDNNLAACKFYLSNGFFIGGMNKNVYEGTKQEGKTDIYFFKRI